MRLYRGSFKQVNGRFVMNLDSRIESLVLANCGSVLAYDFESEDYRKWLCLWSMGLVGEIVELYQANDYQAFLDELGDVLWYLKALDILLGRNMIVYNRYCKPSDSDFERFLKTVDFTDLTINAGKYLNTVKKYARDYPMRDISTLYSLVEIYRHFVSVGTYDLPSAVDVLERKLTLRYPEGFYSRVDFN